MAVRPMKRHRPLHRQLQRRLQLRLQPQLLPRQLPPLRQRAFHQAVALIKAVNSFMKNTEK